MAVQTANGTSMLKKDSALTAQRNVQWDVFVGRTASFVLLKDERSVRSGLVVRTVSLMLSLLVMNATASQGFTTTLILMRVCHAL
jgi:hypothetical protein